MNATGATYVLEARNARAMPLTIELRAGATLDPLSVGRNGTWLLDAAGVLMQHAFLYFDGEHLFVQSTDQHVPVVLAGKPIPTQWTRVTAPCTLVFGACTIEYQRAQPAPVREAAPSEPGPDTVPGEPPSVAATLPQLWEPDSERTEVGPPPVAAGAGGAAGAVGRERLAHLAATTPIFEMALRQQQPLGALPATERLPQIGPRAIPPAAGMPPAPPPPGRPLAATMPLQPAMPAFEPKPPPWPPPGMLAAVATARPPSAPPTHEFKPIDPAGPDDATLYAPIPVDAPARPLGTGPYAMPTPGPMVVPLPTGTSQPPVAMYGAAPPAKAPSPLAAWWTAAPLPRKALAILLPIAVVLAVLSLFTSDAPPPAAKRAPAAKASATSK